MIADKSLKNPLTHRYVNSMLNICYLTGFVREPNESGFMLQQNNNRAQAIPISVSRGTRLPKDKTPVTVLCHLYGTANADGEQNLFLKAIDIQKPSVRSMPALTTWIRGAKGANQDEFRPFQGGGTRIAEADTNISENSENNPEKAENGAEALPEGFSEPEQILRDILEATRGRLDTRLGDNSNVALMAGFIDSMAYVSGNEHQKDGYGALLVRQHADPSRCIPVRLYNKSAHAIMRQVAPGMPISIAGQVRMKVLPNDDGTIRAMNLHIRVSDLYRADRNKDILEIPDWWGEIRDRLIEERQNRKQAAKAPAKPESDGAEGL
ncbi:MAG: hypothetical protein BroJett012_08720 [Betaproteobacteria bacterium]|nr:hypothetical protein [Rhodocyclaceae bacterium]GIK44969.1 MAG: hypothetical protein BroJett012_08720 [Betaproteobacteria bacterium]